MARNRLLLAVLAGGLVSASGAWADEVGYIDCSNHPDETQVLAKAAKTDEVVAALPCGERFTVVVRGFFFSKIQTKDGKLGYVLTNSISRDTSVSAVPQAMPPLAPARAARSGNPFATIAGALRPKQTQGLRVPAPPTPAPASTPTATQAAAAASSSSNASAAAAQANSNTPAAAQPASASASPAGQASTTAETKVAVGETFTLQKPADSPMFPAKSAVIVQSDANSAEARRRANETAAEAALAKANTEEPAAAAPATVSAPKQEDTAPIRGAVISGPNGVNFPEKNGVIIQPDANAAAQPESNAAAQPEPAPAQPEPPAVQPAAFRAPRGGGVLGGGLPGSRREPLVELFGGFAFAAMTAGSGNFTNFNGALGSFGWNAKPWLQVVADTSYNVVTTNGVKNVLYGNHYGPRFFLRGHHRWGATPFVEGLVGGSRADTTVSGTGGYTTSQNCISIKAGGGLDLKPSRHLEVRLFNIDYYRTAFGTNVQQSNYWISAGIVLRLFGGGAE